MGNWIHYGAQRCQKYALHQKKIRIKVVRNWILYKKVRKHICLLPHEWSGGTPKINTFESYNAQKWKTPLAPLQGETDKCVYGLFCTKFNSEQLLFEAFFDVMRIFGSFEPQSESNFLFLYIIRFQIYWSLEPPTSTHGGERHMRSGTFLYEIQFQTTFIWSFFWCTAYFWHHWAPKWI